jgi:hypothetical protein
MGLAVSFSASIELGIKFFYLKKINFLLPHLVKPTCNKSVSKADLLYNQTWKY